MESDVPVASTSKLPLKLEGDDVVIKGEKDEHQLSSNDVDPSESHIGYPGQFDENEEIVIKKMPSAKLVGLQYYGGHRKFVVGQQLFAKRDKMNINDRNAILVLHTDERTKCGFIKRELAAKLAPLLDEGKITLVPFVIQVPDSNVGLKEVPIELEIRGPRHVARDPRLDWLFPSRRKPKKPPAAASTAMNGRTPSSSKSKAASTGSAEENVDPALATSVEELQVRPVGDVLSALFNAAGNDPMSLPLHPKPPGRKTKRMKTDLLPFQSQGLRWMIKMEHPQLPSTPDEPPTQLWLFKKDKDNKPYYYNLATRMPQRTPPKLRRGGILADEMGLGKTMQTIALISTDDTGEHVLDRPEEPDERYDDMTLIVCPLSVASNWTTQLHVHVGSKRLKWYLYHGEGRSVSRKELRQNYDVVIVPYNTLANEYAAAEAKSKEIGIEESEPPSKKVKKDKPLSTLHGIKWRRVVLDEGHSIKNPQTKMSIACINLTAERRWVLTGTPIINSSNDLGAMLHFLKLCSPLDERSQWKRLIEDPLKADEEHAKMLLRAVVSSTTLRRTKNMRDKQGSPLISLPEIKFYMHRVQLSPGTRKLYDVIQNGLSNVVSKLLGQGGKHYTVLMVILLRLRQLACHPTLCPETFINAVRADQAERLLHEGEIGLQVQIGKHEPDRARLQNRLRQLIAEAGEDCALCRNLPSETRITVCGHIFCLACIEDYIDQEHECPVCARKLSLKELIGSPRGSEEPVNEESEVSGRQSADGLDKLAPLEAAKTDELIRLLRATDEGVKSLVFSQWTTHLNIIQEALKQAGISTCRFDGSMSQREREDVINLFSVPYKPEAKKQSPTVMLISLRAGALGLNLTCASQVFLMDPWWQASIEQQAIDRVYRIGQTKPVRVFQLVADKTVEARVLEIQQKKNQLIEHAFSGTKSGGRGGPEKIESRLEDIKAIFGRS